MRRNIAKILVFVFAFVTLFSMAPQTALAQDFTVTFDSQGGSIVASAAVQENGTITKPADPTKDGYTFGGWYKEQDCQNAWNFGSPVTVDTTLYAKWSQAVTNCTVTFDSQGGSTISSATVQKNSAAAKPADPTKDGYTFGGWYTEQDCQNAWNFGSPVTADMTLYAKWSQAITNCTVTFDSQGGSTISFATVQKNSAVAKPADPTKDGYTFGGWYKEQACQNAWDFGNLVVGNITLFAKWTAVPANTPKVTLNKSSPGDADGDGYLDSDMNKIKTFLGLQSAQTGTTNAAALGYNINDPSTWSAGEIIWTTDGNGIKALNGINWNGKSLAGNLDLSACQSLSYVNCSGNQLDSIDISNCPNFTLGIWCDHNNLTSLNIAGDDSINLVGCNDNKLASLDVKNHASLTYVSAYNNPITSIDITGCTNLGGLDCFNCNLSSLNAGGDAKLQKLNCSGNNNLNSFNISGCGNLETLDISGIPLTSIDLSSYSKLTELDCDYSKFSSIDLHANTGLKELSCTHNTWPSLDLSACTQLDALDSRWTTLQDIKANIGGRSIHLASKGHGVVQLSLRLSYFGGRSGSVDDTLTAGAVRDMCYDFSKWTSNGQDFSTQQSLALTNPGAYDLTAEFSSQGIAAYNTHDFNAFKNFLSQTSAQTDKTNADVLGYDINDPSTWTGVEWDTDDTGKAVLHNLNLGNDGDENGGLAGNLDLSGCDSLLFIQCYNNQIVSIDASNCPNLMNLMCNRNKLTSINIQGDDSLNNLDCWDNQLTSLDLKDYASLENIYSDQNPLNTLDVTGCTSLKELGCSGGNLSSLDLSGHTALQMLRCGGNNNLASLNISGCNNLNALDLSWTKLSSMDLSGFTNLTTLWWEGYELPSIDLHANTSLKEFSCRYSNLTSLDLSACNLDALDTRNTRLQDITANVNGKNIHLTQTGSGFVALTYNLHELDNQETNNGLQAFANPGAGFVKWTSGGTDYSSDNPLTLTAGNSYNLTANFNMDLAYNSHDLKAIKDFLGQNSAQTGKTNADVLGYDINDPSTWKAVNWNTDETGAYVLNGIASGNEWDGKGLGGNLDLSGSQNLQYVNCGNNQIGSIDISNCPNFNGIWCQNNGLTSLNFTGSNKIQQLGIGQNQLTQIDVKNLASLHDLYCDQNPFTSLDVTGCDNLQNLSCGGCNLTSLDMGGHTALQNLFCWGNNDLSTLNLNGCGNLEVLNFGGTQINISDFSAFTKLTKLWCDGCQLPTIDLHANTALKMFSCRFAQFTSLDLSACNLDAIDTRNTRLQNITANVNGENIHLTQTGNGFVALTYNLHEINDQETNNDLQAYANPGAGFVKWTSGGTDYSSDNPLTLTAGNSYDLTANFNMELAYNAQDLAALKDFLSQDSADTGKTNADVLGYDINDPTTWKDVIWNTDDSGAYVLNGIASGNEWDGKGLAGNLNLSGCKNLQYINCGDNQINSIDISNCPDFNGIWCQNNGLTSLNITGDDQIQNLGVNQNQLTQITVKDFASLQNLFCDQNPITSLDVTGCGNLKDLECGGCSLSGLDVSGHTALQTLYVWGNSNLTSLNVSGCSSLQDLACCDCNLSGLDVSGNTALQQLNTNNNPNFVSINVNGCSSLIYMDCGKDNLPSMDVHGNTSLENLFCWSNPNLTTVNASGCTNLKVLHCDNSNSISTLDVSDCGNLQDLNCGGCNLSSLDLSGHNTLQELRCWGNNNLSSLDLTGCANLEALDLSGTPASISDFSPFTKLTELRYDGCQLKTINLQANTALTKFSCKFAQFTTLDLSACSLNAIDTRNTRLQDLKANINGKDIHLTQTGIGFVALTYNLHELNDQETNNDLQAYANPGAGLVNWTGTVTSTNNPFILTPGNSYDLTANFDSAQHIMVGLAMPNSSLTRWSQDGANMQSQFQAAGYQVDLEYANNDVATQVQQLETMIQTGCKVLVIAAIDSSALQTVLDDAKKANVVIFAYDRLIPGADYYTTFNSYEVGVLQAQWIISHMKLDTYDKSKGPIRTEIFAGSQYDNNAFIFNKGEMDTLKPYFDNGVLNVTSGQTAMQDIEIEAWDSGVAQDRMDDLLSTYYTDKPVQLVISPNDSLAQGITASLNAAGYSATAGASKPFPVITGQDCDITSVKNIITGTQSMSIFKDTRTLAAQTVKMVGQIVSGAQVDVNNTTDFENVPTYLCDPVTVDVGNYKQSLIDSRYYTAEQLAVSSTVTFETNGGSSVSPITQDIDSTIKDSPITAMTGYTFNGWYSDSGLNTPVSFPYTISGDATLYAKWTINQCTISFVANGGSAVADIKQDYNTTITTAPATTKTGYTFDKWYADSGLTTAATFPYTVAGDATLYAGWKAIQYTISYVVNGGSTVSDTKQDYNTTINTAPVTKKSGYTFGGWYTNMGFTTQITFPYTITGNATFYAKWGYTVTFDTGTGGSKVDSVFVLPFNTITQPTNPTNTGYTFGGWYKEAGHVNAWNFSNTVTGSMTLYAKWNPNQYTITFNTKGSPVTAIKQYYSTTINASPVTTRTGYTFNGWYTDSGFAADSKVTFPYTITDNATLYAKWTINQYTVTFDSKGGNTITGSPFTYNYGDKITKPADPTKPGSTFSGWYSDTALTKAWDFTKGTVGTANITLTAKWTINQYTITFVTNGGSAVAAIKQYYNTIITTVPVTKTGYTFNGWYTDSGFAADSKVTFPYTITDNATLYAKWTINQYTVTFNLLGGNGTINSQKLNYGTKVTQPADPTKANYSFGGWYTDQQCTKAWDFNNNTVGAGDMTLYARWGYKVIFNSNGGSTIVSLASTVAPVNGKIIKPADPTYAGYVFGGWYTDQNTFKNPWNFSTGTVKSDNLVTLYAKWQYLVTFDSQGGSAVSSVQVDQNGKVTKPTTNPTRAGYTFDAWYKSTTFTAANKWNFATDTVTAATTLYANWIHTVTFKDSVTGSTITSEKVNCGDKVIQPDDPTKAGYSFDAWCTDQKCTTLWNFATTMGPGDMILYAKWKDDVPPTLTGITPASGTTLTTSTFKLSANGVSDPSGVRNVIFGLYSFSQDSYKTFTTVQAGTNWQANIDLTTFGSVNGAYQIYVWGTDKNGFFGLIGVSSISVYVQDKQPPAYQSVTPAKGATVTGATTMLSANNVTDASGVQSIVFSVYKDGDVSANSKVYLAANNSGNWQATFNLSDLTVSGKTRFNVQVWGLDKAGNFGLMGTTYFTVDLP